MLATDALSITFLYRRLIQLSSTPIFTSFLVPVADAPSESKFFTSFALLFQHHFFGTSAFIPIPAPYRE